MSLSFLRNGVVVETQAAVGPGPHLFTFAASTFALLDTRALRVQHPALALLVGIRVCAHWSY